MKKILNEPLVLFLVAGALLFGLYEIVGTSEKPENETIVVGPDRIEQIQTAWEKQWRRQPTEEELEKLIEQFIQEEVLYREALGMGLEKDDTIIRRRLAQKMKFLIQDIADQNQPEESELKTFFEENREQFRLPAQISFTHVYFSPDHRGDTMVKDAMQVLDSLKAGNVKRAPESGDPFMLHYDYVEITQAGAMRLFGKKFADELFLIKPGRWQGPIPSGYGTHLALVTDYIDSRVPEYAEIEEQVRQEYIAIQRRKTNENAIKGLKARYRIVIEQDATKGDKIQSQVVEASGDAS